jgi:hypothetical protein
MLYREIIAVCSEIHIKHINTVCGQNVEFVDVKPRGTYSDHCAVHIVTTRLQSVLNPFKQYYYPELYINTQSEPHSKHTPSRL